MANFPVEPAASSEFGRLRNIITLYGSQKKTKFNKLAGTTSSASNIETPTNASSPMTPDSPSSTIINRSAFNRLAQPKAPVDALLQYALLSANGNNLTKTTHKLRKRIRSIPVFTKSWSLRKILNSGKTDTKEAVERDLDKLLESESQQIAMLSELVCDDCAQKIHSSNPFLALGYTRNVNHKYYEEQRGKKLLLNPLIRSNMISRISEAHAEFVGFDNRITLHNAIGIFDQLCCAITRPDSNESHLLIEQSDAIAASCLHLAAKLHMTRHFSVNTIVDIFNRKRATPLHLETVVAWDLKICHCLGYELNFTTVYDAVITYLGLWKRNLLFGQLCSLEKNGYCASCTSKISGSREYVKKARDHSSPLLRPFNFCDADWKISRRSKHEKFPLQSCAMLLAELFLVHPAGYQYSPFDIAASAVYNAAMILVGSARAGDIMCFFPDEALRGPNRIEIASIPLLSAFAEQLENDKLVDLSVLPQSNDLVDDIDEMNRYLPVTDARRQAMKKICADDDEYSASQALQAFIIRHPKLFRQKYTFRACRVAKKSKLIPDFKSELMKLKDSKIGQRYAKEVIAEYGRVAVYLENKFIRFITRVVPGS